MKKQLTVLQTSDLHGYIYPRSYATGENEDIGLARIATLIEEHRNPNSLLIDSGDTIQGSPLTYFLSKKPEKIHPIAKIMNTLKYDYITIGNHEFNYGLDYLSTYLDNIDATILNCNILKNDKPFYGIPYDIREINDLKVAIIGVTTHYIPNWEQESHIKDLTFIDAFSALEKTVSEIKDLVDIVIVNYHGGFERDLQTGLLNVEDTGENQGYKMIDKIDGIDLFLSGHQHRFLTGKHKNTYYVQPGFNGLHLSKSTIHFDTETKELSIDSVLLTATSTDENILNMVDETEKKTNAYLDTPVGKTTLDLLITDQIQARINKHPLVTFINQVQLEYTNADISCCSLGNNVSGFKKDITIRDVISTYIYPNTLVVKKVKGTDLLKGLEKSAEFFEYTEGKIVVSEAFKHPKVQLYSYDMYDGIEYEIHIKNKIGNRIKNVTFNGKRLDLTKEYSLAMNNYRASGGGDYMFYKKSETVQDTQTEILELLINYIVSKKDLQINHKENIKFIY